MAQQTQEIETLSSCWPTVYDAEPTLNQQFNYLYLLGDLDVLHDNGPPAVICVYLATFPSLAGPCMACPSMAGPCMAGPCSVTDPCMTGPCSVTDPSLLYTHKCTYFHSTRRVGQWILLYVAFCIIMAISILPHQVRQSDHWSVADNWIDEDGQCRDRRKLEVGTKSYSYRMTSRVLYSARYHRQLRTIQAFEQFGTLHMHYNDVKYPARPEFEPGTSRLQAPVDTNEPSGPASTQAYLHCKAKQQ